MRLTVTDEAIEIRLAWWEKLLGLMRDIRVARRSIGDITVDPEPIDNMKGTGLKAGLRLPGVIYIARSIKLDRAWIVRRGVPALSFSVSDGSPLTHVTVSTPQAQELAERLSAGPYSV